MKEKRLLSELLSLKKKEFYTFCLMDFAIDDLLRLRKEYLSIKQKQRDLEFLYYLRTGRFPNEVV